MTATAASASVMGHKKLCRVARGYMAPSRSEQIISGPLLHQTFSDPSVIQKPLYTSCRVIGDEALVRICVTPSAASIIGAGQDGKHKTLSKSVSYGNALWDTQDDIQNSHNGNTTSKRVIFSDTVTVHEFSDYDDDDDDDSDDDDEDEDDAGISPKDEEYDDCESEFFASYIRRFLTRNSYRNSQKMCSLRSSNTQSCQPSSGEPNKINHQGRNSTSQTCQQDRYDYNSNLNPLSNPENTLCNIEKQQDNLVNTSSKQSQHLQWQHDNRESENRDSSDSINISNPYSYDIMLPYVESRPNNQTTQSRDLVNITTNLKEKMSNLVRDKSKLDQIDLHTVKDAPSFDENNRYNKVRVSTDSGIVPDFEYRTRIYCTNNTRINNQQDRTPGNISVSNCSDSTSICHHDNSTSCENCYCKTNGRKTHDKSSRNCCNKIHSINQAFGNDVDTESVIRNAQLDKAIGCTTNNDTEDGIGCNKSMKIFVDLGDNYSSDELAVMTSKDNCSISILLKNSNKSSQNNNMISKRCTSSISNNVSDSKNNTDYSNFRNSSEKLVDCSVTKHLKDRTGTQNIVVPHGYWLLNHLQDSTEGYSHLKTIPLPRSMDSNNMIAILDSQGYLLIDAPILNQ